MRRAKYTIKVPCPDCLGTGNAYLGGRKVKCEPCKGSGEVTRTINEVESEQ